MADNGRFVVAWSTYQASIGSYSSMARVYNATGTPATAAITVAAGSRSFSNYMSGVATDAVGNFAVLYENVKISGLATGAKNLKVQRFTSVGSATGKAVDVQTPSLINGQASIAMDGPAVSSSPGMTSSPDTVRSSPNASQPMARPSDRRLASTPLRIPTSLSSPTSR